MAYLALFVSVAIAYLIGAIPTSYLITRRLKGIDIRSAGSGNAGATNVLRVVGKAPAILTLVGDIAKGVVAVTAVVWIFYPFMADLIRYDLYLGLMAFAVVSGHIWPVFLRFKGGKGVATTLGVGIAVAPLALLPTAVVWLVVFLLSRYVSLASVCALVAFPICMTFFDYSFFIVFFSVIICGIGIYKHRTNVERLLKGEENKTKFG